MRTCEIKKITCSSRIHSSVSLQLHSLLFFCLFVWSLAFTTQQFGIAERTCDRRAFDKKKKMMKGTQGREITFCQVLKGWDGKKRPQKSSWNEEWARETHKQKKPRKLFTLKETINFVRKHPPRHCVREKTTAQLWNTDKRAQRRWQLLRTLFS